MPVEAKFTLQIFTEMKTAEWDRILISLTHPHLLQSSHWAELKRPNGWQPIYLLWTDDDQNPVSAAVLHKKVLPRLLGGCILYSPRGPILDWGNQPLRSKVLSDLQTVASQQKAMFLKIDPEVALAWSQNPLEGKTEDETGHSAQQELKQSGWKFSPDQLQFRNTVLLDLSLEESALLDAMKQKTRYNIRLAQKKGVSVRKGSEADLENLYQMYAQTSLRDGFAIRAREYYLDVWTRLMNVGIAHPLIAEVDGEAVSALVLFIYGGRGYYFYGMSTEAHRDMMPNHLLQWEAILLSKQTGCTTYDFWGAPDEFDPQDSMYGVYKFKEGFNGQVLFGLGAWDYILSHWKYELYTRLLPVVLNWMRRLGRRKVQQEVSTP
jgi:peptidoglycan pentaglycine glycine transferase (the first glycine)